MPNYSETQRETVVDCRLLDEHKLLINNAPLIIYLKDENNSIVSCSPYAAEFLEKGADKSFNYEFLLEEIKKAEETDEDYVRIHKKEIVKESILKDKKGKEHWYKIRKIPVISKNNSCKILTIIENIDGKKSEEIQQSLFLATLSHDLKNILQAQIRSLELINKGSYGEVNDSQKEMLDMTIESALFMKNLLFSITKTCKENNGIIILERSNFDVKELLTLCIKEISSVASEKNVNIKFNTKENIFLYADKTQIRRVIENILNNSVNYAFDNTEINIELKKENSSIVFSIENHSKAISDKLKTQIFDKYVSSMKNGFNIGLGLYFCKKVINSHEGKIYLDTNGELNKFVVELPILDENRIHIKEISL